MNILAAASVLALFQGGMAAWGLVDMIVAIIIVAACVGVLYVVLGVFGFKVPPWVITIFWIVVAAVVAIMAIRFIASL